MKKRQKKGHTKRNTRGAVTVFLTLILVPCIIVVCAFDDISRVQLSKAGASSAADLALYSLMADYDVDLKEYYGLVASCQNIEQFYEKTESYFCGMMDANGMSDAGSELFTEYIHALKNGDLTDFLQVDIVEPAKVDAASNAQLGENPALIEDGIVEFMKYRGPASIVMHVIDRFTDLDLSGVSSDVDDNAKIVEKKELYAEAEGDLLEAALYSYIAVHNYEKAWNTGNPLAQKGYSGLAQDLSALWEDLERATVLTAKYYFADTDHLAKVAFPVYGSRDVPAASAEAVGIPWVKEDGSTSYCIHAAKLQELLAGVDEEISVTENARNSAQSRFPQFSSGDNPAVYLLEVQDAFPSGSEPDTIAESMERLMKQYGLIQAAMNCEPFPEGDDLPSDWRSQLSQAETKIQQLQKTLSDPGSSGYAKYVQVYNHCIAEHFDKIKNKGYSFASGFTGGTETFGSFASQIANRIPELRSELQELVDKLSAAIDGGEVDINGRKETAVPLDELVEKAAAYSNARQQWGNTADRYDTDYARQERDAYHGASDSDQEAIASRIHAQSVGELKQRLSNIRKDLQDLITAMDMFTYGGEKVEQIRSADSLVTLGRSVMPQRASRSLSQNEAEAKSFFHALIQPAAKEVFRVPAMNNAKNGNQPDLSIQTPELYAFFKSRFSGRINEIEAAKKENDKKNKEYEDKAEEEKEKSQKIDNDLLAGKGGDISGGHGGSPVNLGTVISGIVTAISNILSGSGDELRDQLYVCEYIMNMFSYSTINLEEKEHKDGKDAEEAKKTKRETQSMTNRAINHENNQANLGEVEYILYGNASIDKNLEQSYQNLFAIREALNVVSGFVNFYQMGNPTADVINETALSIAAATGGVVPVSVTKCVLIGVLATMESSYDLNQLKKGKPVVFYKSSHQEWHYAFHGNGFSPDKGKKEEKEKGMYYSDYMYLFLMTGLTSGLYKDMLLRTGDLIEANMQLASGSSYDLAKARCYFHLKARVQVKPLMLTLPIVRSMDGADPSGILENKDWCTYDVDIYRGYS